MERNFVLRRCACGVCSLSSRRRPDLGVTACRARKLIAGPVISAATIAAERGAIVVEALERSSGKLALPRSGVGDAFRAASSRDEEGLRLDQPFVSKPSPGESSGAAAGGFAS